jgi:hypothetical protein
VRCRYNNNDSKPGLVLQVLYWNVGVNISLDVPDLPLPKSMVQDMLRMTVCAL